MTAIGSFAWITTCRVAGRSRIRKSLHSVSVSLAPDTDFEDGGYTVVSASTWHFKVVSYVAVISHCKHGQAQSQVIRSWTPWGKYSGADVTSIERDSAKDQAVVFIFIIATVGLLGWALLRPWLGIWIQVCQSTISPTCLTGINSIYVTALPAHDYTESTRA